MAKQVAERPIRWPELRKNLAKKCLNQTKQTASSQEQSKIYGTQQIIKENFAKRIIKIFHQGILYGNL
jgi:hypothetical protein